MRGLANHYAITYEREAETPASIEVGISGFGGKGSCAAEPHVLET